MIALPRFSLIWLVSLLLPLMLATGAFAQLDQSCTATVLNRSAQVNPDGSFSVPNVPVEPGLFRARIICLNNETTTKRYSEFTTLVKPFTPIENITFGALDPLPVALHIAAPQQLINTPGQSAQFTVIATLPNRSEKDVTRNDTGTLWMSSNSNIASHVGWVVTYPTPYTAPRCSRMRSLRDGPPAWERIERTSSRVTPEMVCCAACR